MLRRKMTIMAGAIAAGAALASPAQALFGPTCIPTLYNCMCTYMVPCPVSDPKNFAQQALEGTQLKDTLKLMQDIRDPQTMFLKALRGEGPVGIPGLDSIGIDINGLMSGDLSSLGLPGGDIATQLSNLGIDGNMLASIAKGELDPGALLTVAQNAGLDLSALEGAGLSMDKITALANGELDPSQVLDLASNLNLQAGVLNDIGITEDLLVGISQGTVEAERVLQIAQNAGLSMESLSAVGLDPSTIASLPNAGPEAVASVLQKVGYDSSIIGPLGLDAGIISQISTGGLPSAGSIADLAKGTGIDPSAITLPSIDGPLSLPGGSTARPQNLQDTITIPAGSVPGLQNAINQATGISAGSGTFSGSGANTQAMCASDKSLISVGVPPNGFGSDIEVIDMAISGGTLEAHPEAVDAAQTAAGSAAAFGVGRSMQVRPIILKAIEAVDTFDDMIKESKTLEDDLIVNDTIHAQLMTAQAEKASILTSLVSVSASRRMHDQNLSALPNFPGEGRFRDAIEYGKSQSSSQSDRQENISSKNYSEASQAYSRIQQDARTAILHYNLTRDAKIIESGLPAIKETIEIHETYKGLLYDLERVIRSALSNLYGSDADAAWAILHPQLMAAAGDYLSARKYQDGFAQAQSFSQAVTSQAATTPYGKRVLVNSGGGETAPTFTTTPQTPYSYPNLDTYADSKSEPYKISPASMLMGRGEDAVMPPGMELVGVLQYYFETARREAWTAGLRRGDANKTMTSAFWNEMIHHAPQCLSGPVQFSAAAIQNRPEMFDLSKDCNHLVWSYGDPGDYIDASQLGGADAALWLSKISLDRVKSRTGGPGQVLQTIRDALNEISASSAASILEMQGHPEPGQHIDAIKAALEQALADPGFTVQAQLPPRPSS